MKKKILPILLVLFSIFVLFGCETTTKDNSKYYGNIEDGLVKDYVDAKTFVASRQDTRSNAYSAYQPDGTKIGDYKTIATAINAAVDYDTVSKVIGSYVTSIGGTQKLFYNKAGYTEDNDDQYWFYQNGNALDGYWCWDGASHMNSLRNTNFIIHEVSNYGTASAQSWNSYGLLDSFGERYNSISAQSWELSSSMDAAIMEFTYRRGGITKLEYELDLSGVTIKPPYDGGDKTYAFFGFYAWQDYYVIAVGLACDTATGNWYQFVGTSRDNSFSDVKYDTGACVMTSTWNEQGGYFVPDCESVKATIETKLNYDSEADEYYQTDDVKFELSTGTVYSRTITDALVGTYFTGFPLSMENSYIFIAGLDIKNQIATGVLPKNCDYFNGSEFNNLAITSARCYVPTEEELSDLDYGYVINSEWRGLWHDLLLNNNEDTDEIMDYVVMNTNICCEYSAVNKKDVFSFSYDGSPKGTSNIGSNLAVYQNKIDALKAVTQDNVLEYNEQISEIATWLVDKQTIVPDKYMNCLDFSAYHAALELLNSISLSPEGEAVLQAINGMTIENAAEFKTIYETQYLALSSDDQKAVRITFGAGEFDAIVGYATYLAALESETSTASVYESYVFFKKSGSVYESSSQMKNYTAVEANAELLRNIELIATGTRWVGEYVSYNDDPNNSLVKAMNGDNNFYPSIRIVMLVEYFKDHNIELPTYITDKLSAIDYESFYNDFYYPLYMITKIALKIENDHITALNSLNENELAFLNEYWVGSYFLGEQITWNWYNGNQFMTYFDGRSASISYMAGSTKNVPFKNYAATLNDFLVTLGYTANSDGWGVTALEIK